MASSGDAVPPGTLGFIVVTPFYHRHERRMETGQLTEAASLLMPVGFSSVRVHAMSRSLTACPMDVPWPRRPRATLCRLARSGPSPWRLITIDTSGGWKPDNSPRACLTLLMFGRLLGACIHAMPRCLTRLVRWM